MKPWTASYFLVATSLLLVSIVAHPASAAATGDLVWSLQVSGDRAQLVVNKFAQSSGAFPTPLRNIRVSRLQPRNTGTGEGRILSLDGYLSPLEVTENGEITAGASVPQSVPLSFVPTRLVSGGGAFLMPKMPERMRPLAIPATFRARYEVSIPALVDSADRLDLWTVSPDKSVAVVNTGRSTRLINMATAAATDMPEGPLGGVCFAPRATIFAAAAISGPRPRMGGPALAYCVTVRNWRTGQSLKSEPAGGVSKLAFLPSRDYVVFTRHNGGRPAETVAMSTTTGVSTILPGIPDGDRYYSATDGLHMLVVKPVLTRGNEELGYGRASYYDITDLGSPKLLAEYDASDLILSGAVSDDGKLVALQVLENGDATRLTRRVVVLDQDLHVVFEPVRRSPDRGVQFAGRYLFTGIQGNTVELIAARPTSISAFDFNR